jgi:PleD family two-component response regulator
MLVLDSSPESTVERIEDIRAAIEGLELYHGKDRVQAPLVRVGIASAGRDGTTAHELLDAASAAAQGAR